MLTKNQNSRLVEYLNTHELAKGLGTKESACSIAAINLAISGEVTAEIPSCMSLVIGSWIIPIQDAIPTEIRNSLKWKSLLPLAAGTGRNPEDELKRLELILDWMWVQLAQIQPIADQKGFGLEWNLLKHKTGNAARAAARAANRAAWAADAAARADCAAWAAGAAARAAGAAADARAAGARAAWAAWAAADARAAARAAGAADGAAADFWAKTDPCSLLKELIEVS